jgi:hypothetical protein
MELEEPEERRRFHGTATNLPSLEELEAPNDAPVLVFREVERLPVVPAEVLSLEVDEESVEPLEPPDPMEITAKSILPDIGLMMMSLIVPTELLPQDPLICAPISFEARTS